MSLLAAGSAATVAESCAEEPNDSEPNPIVRRSNIKTVSAVAQPFPTPPTTASSSS